MKDKEAYKIIREEILEAVKEEESISCQARICGRRVNTGKGGSAAAFQGLPKLSIPFISLVLPDYVIKAISENKQGSSCPQVS
jgi:hypothetical protein